jgi:NAD(P)H-dependent flavin oxidoreductase YrpB (nitropropane dioxygenase family)
MAARNLANRFTKEYLEMKKCGANPLELNAYLNEHDQSQSQYLGQADESEICCGKVAGLISEVQDAGEVTRDIVENVSSCFEELKQKLGDII